VAHANTFQEFERRITEFKRKGCKWRTSTFKPVRYWGLISIFQGRWFKVVLRRNGDGQLEFWSIMTLASKV